MVSLEFKQTVYRNADTTVHITSTILTAPGTAAVVSIPDASPNLAVTKKGLTPGGQARIDVGTASGSLLFVSSFPSVGADCASQVSWESAPANTRSQYKDAQLMASTVSGVF